MMVLLYCLLGFWTLFTFGVLICSSFYGRENMCFSFGHLGRLCAVGLVEDFYCYHLIFYFVHLYSNSFVLFKILSLAFQLG